MYICTITLAISTFTPVHKAILTRRNHIVLLSQPSHTHHVPPFSLLAMAASLTRKNKEKLREKRSEGHVYTSVCGTLSCEQQQHSNEKEDTLATPNPRRTPRHVDTSNSFHVSCRVSGV